MIPFNKLNRLTTTSVLGPSMKDLTAMEAARSDVDGLKKSKAKRKSSILTAADASLSGRTILG